MKKSASVIAIIFLVAILGMSACKKSSTTDPCDGKGTLNIENKLDSTISVKITETHNTMSILKDYTLPVTMAGNQPYTISIYGPSYHKDTTIMILFCDNKLYIVKK